MRALRGYAILNEAYASLEGYFGHRLVPERVQVSGDVPSSNRKFVPSGVALGVGWGAACRHVQGLMHVSRHVDQEADHQRFLQHSIEIVRKWPPRLQRVYRFNLAD